MGIISINTDTTGQVQVLPRRVKIITTDGLATVTAAGYLNQEVLSTYAIFTSDIFDIFYSWSIDTQSGSYDEFLCSISNGIITLSVVPASGVTTPTIANHIAVYTNTLGHFGEDAATAINGGNLQAGLSGTAGTMASFPSAALSGKLVLAAVTNAGGNFNTTISNASSVGQSQVISVPDSGAATANFILDNKPSGQTVSAASSSATPGTLRALVGSFTESATTMTSGNVVGVRGVVNAVGASGGFIYGVQGKIVATGTLSGSLWAPAVFGQLDVSAATINGAQVAALWGDWGTTGATATDLSGCRGIVFTNTTANVLNAQDYRYGNATYLLELAGAGGTLNYYAAAGTSAGSAGNATHCAAQQVIKIEINGVAAYIPVFTQNT